MPIRLILASLLTTILLAPIPSPADESLANPSAATVRYYEKDGVTYCETRRSADTRVAEARLEPRAQTVYRTQAVTQTQDVVREYWTPVTEYCLEGRWVNRWNPFGQPYVAYRYVPRTRWEKKSEVVKVPVSVCQVVPETHIAPTPVPSYQTVPRRTIAQTAVQPSATAAPSATSVPIVARQQQVGGIRRLDSDPPRYGASSGWRSAGTLR